MGDDAPFSDEVAILAEAVAAGGGIAMRFFGKAPAQWVKGADSPVSEADIAVDDFLRRRLTEQRPSYGWLSEETTDTAERLAAERLFIIDPIDGTRAFLEGRSDWTVSAAVVEAGRPIAAALYAPATNELFLAERGRGAIRNGEAIAAGRRVGVAGAVIAGPRRFHAASAARPAPRIASLAYRLAGVADGRIDAATAGANSHDWDLAAADLLVHEAGGRLTGLDGRPPIYNRRDPTHGVLVAAGPGLHADLLQMVAAAALATGEARAHGTGPTQQARSM